MMASNGEQLLLTLVIPLVVLIGLGTTGVVDVGADGTRSGRLDVVLPGVLALAVLSTAFTGLAIQTGFERRYGVLKRLGATPLSRGLLLGGKAVAVLVVEAVQVLVLVAVAGALGWRPAGGGAAVSLVLLMLGTGCFASLGLLLAGVLRAEATLAAANAVYLVLLVAGGVAVPLDRLPTAAQRWVELLPSAALAEGLRRALAGATVGWGPWLVLVAWTVGGVLLVRRTFRWR
jgi:ABC-2 type transport system permease protein